MLTKFLNVWELPKNNIFKEENVFILCKLKAWIGQLLQRHTKSQHNNKVK